VLADHDFHPDEPTARIFRTPPAGVLRLDDRAAISEADYGGIVLRQGPGLTRPAPALAQLTLIKVATLVRPGVVQASAKVRRAPTWPGLRPSPRRHVLDALK
jgi:hypothetical protein